MHFSNFLFLCRSEKAPVCKSTRQNTTFTRQTGILDRTQRCADFLRSGCGDTSGDSTQHMLLQFHHVRRLYVVAEATALQYVKSCLSKIWKEYNKQTDLIGLVFVIWTTRHLTLTLTLGHSKLVVGWILILTVVKACFHSQIVTQTTPVTRRIIIKTVIFQFSTTSVWAKPSACGYPQKKETFLAQLLAVWDCFI